MWSMSPAPKAAGMSIIPEATMETTEASPAHFRIKIESFSLFGKHGIHKYETGEFTSGGYKWRLIICPNEEKTGEDKEYISVYIALLDTSSLAANWEKPGKRRRFQEMKPEWGFSKFMSKEVLKDPSNGYLINNNCVFGAEIFVVENAAVFECLSLKNVSVPHKRELKISNFSELGDVWTSNEFTAGGLKWKILASPKGEGDEKGRCAAIYLKLLDSKRVKAWHTICIKDQVNNNHHKRTAGDNWFSPSCSAWGWTAFIELACLKDPKRGFIVNDCCLLEIEISVQAVA